MNKIGGFCIFVTTYNRHESLKETLNSLDYNKVVIIDDCSQPPVEGKEVIRTKENNGKEGFWKNINLIFDYIKKNNVQEFMIIPDDLLISKDWVEVYNQFKHLCRYDPNTVAMSLINYRNRRKCWTNFPKKLVRFGDREYFQTQFVDGAFIGNRKMVELLDFKVDPINKVRWKQKPKLSSGVWRQVSKRLNDYGNMYCVKDNEYFRTDSNVSKQSKMHNDRERWSKRIIASCASIPERMGELKIAVESLIDQVDEVWVYLNNYPYIPWYLDNKKIRVFKSQNEVGDITDRGKFYKSWEIDGYHITFDDDLKYPDNHVVSLIEGIDKHSSVCTFHGRVLKNNGKFKDYYKTAAKKTFHWKVAHDKRVELDIGGTGVMGYHTELIKFRWGDLFYDYMCDILVGIKCKLEGVTIYGLPHDDYHVLRLTTNKPLDIYERFKNDDRIQTQLINKYFT
jgi:hypothetical protein